jgi:hypothetical protein
MVKNSLLLLVLGLASFEVAGQQFNISGWVLDSVSREQMIGATVILTGHYFNYWMYDLNGKVNFDLTENSRLYVSFYST